MSALVKVYGASDDLIEFEGEGEVVFLDEEAKGPQLEAEYYLGSGDMSTFVIEGSAGDRAYVRAFYGDEGCWFFTVSQIEEDILIPAGWAITVAQAEDSTYSTVLSIRAMDRLRVRELNDSD